jgi:hypothetical protein
MNRLVGRHFALETLRADEFLVPVALRAATADDRAVFKAATR